MNREIRNLISPKDILIDYSRILRNKITMKGNELKFERIESGFFNKKEYPSKTAQNGINILTLNFEKSIRKSYLNPDIVNIFELIYIILRENYDENTSQLNIVENLFVNILPKFDVSSLKMLFMNIIYKVVFLYYALSETQIKNIIQIIENNPTLIKQNELSKINKPLSVLAFSFKEVYEFITQKDEQSGESMFMLKRAYKNFKQLKMEEENLKISLK